MEFLEKYWEIILIILLVIILIILIIVFWEAIVAALAALGRALLAFILWLLRLLSRIPRPSPRPVPVPRPPPEPPPPNPIPNPVPRPVPVPVPAPPLAAAASIVTSLQSFATSFMGEPGAARAGGAGDRAGADEDEEVDAAPEPGNSDPTASPSMPFPSPPEIEAAGAETGAAIEGALGGALESAMSLLNGAESIPNEPTGIGDELLAGAPAMLGPLMQRMQGSELHDEGRQMIAEFFARVPAARPTGGAPPHGGSSNGPAVA
ncbi:MAG TPA: hypothetical protein VE907_13975 [Gammaproteobacteria bacterium]|nr:hypothetical protein [Gammaproteobacteria bacterium]